MCATTSYEMRPPDEAALDPAFVTPGLSCPRTVLAPTGLPLALGPKSPPLRRNGSWASMSLADGDKAPSAPSPDGFPAGMRRNTSLPDLSREMDARPEAASAPPAAVVTACRGRVRAGAHRRVLTKRARVIAVTIVATMGYPARASGLAFTHPVAAGITLACDLTEAALSSLPPGHAHAVIGLACHLLMDLLTASPY